MWSIIDTEVPLWTCDRAETLRRVADERRLARLIRTAARRSSG